MTLKKHKLAAPNYEALDALLKQARVPEDAVGKPDEFTRQLLQRLDRERTHKTARSPKNGK